MKDGIVSFFNLLSSDYGYLIFFILQGHYGMVNQVIFVA